MTFHSDIVLTDEDRTRLDARLHGSWEKYLTAAAFERDKASAWTTDGYPHYSEDGKWVRIAMDSLSYWDTDRTYHHGNWMSGFAVGVMWLRAVGAEDTDALNIAKKAAQDVARRASDTTTHDLGFLFYPSLVFPLNLGMLTHDEALPALTASGTLLQRFNAAGQYLQAFGPIGHEMSAGTSTIDTMMNLPLLWWASAYSGEPEFLRVGRSHARTSARLFFRADASTYQLNTYDPVSGAVRSRDTYQGASGSSCWSRGQAWAAAGFAWAYACTKEEEFLWAAEKAISYFWAHSGPESIAPWDFADKAPEAPRDSSASAITALGALILSLCHPDPAAAGRWADGSRLALVSLADSCVNDDPSIDGILLRSAYSVPHRWGVDGAAGWGDFYYGLALAVASGAVPASALGFAPTQAGRFHE